MPVTSPIIETRRLLLRQWQAGDLAPYLALHDDPRVIEFLPGPVTVEQASAFFAAQNAIYARLGCGYLALESKHTGELLGFAGLRHLNADFPYAPCYEIGWRLGARHWGQGLATEAARALLNYGFAVLALDLVVSFTAPDNRRSRRLMERLGMRHDPQGDFDPPALPAGHRLAHHVLYRIGPADLPDLHEPQAGPARRPA